MTDYHLDKLRCLSIVMPVYNEAHTLREVLRRVQAVPLPIEIIMIDDCSTDGTRDLLKKIESESSTGIKIIYREKNQGKGAAIREGIKHATGDILIIQDADLEYDPSEYPRLLEPILSGDADVVYGSRFRGERRRVHLFWHTLGNKFLTLLSNICTNLNLSDMETCYKVFKTEIIKSIPLRSNRFGFEPEITAKVAKLRCTIYEVPISYRGRSYAEGKKINWKDGLSAIYTILKFWLIDDLYEETAGLRTLRILEGAGEYNTWLFNQCKPFLGRRILEVGSGIGNITKHLLDRDLVIATDVVEFYLDDLTKLFSHLPNVKIRKLDLLNEQGAKQAQKEFGPDTVLCMNVLEHIEKDKEALRNIGHLLPLGGRLVLLVPAHKQLYSKIDENLGHFRRYSKDEIKVGLEKAGFQIRSSRYLNMLGAIGWFINGKILMRKILPSRQLRLFDLLVKLLAIEKWMPVPFGLSLLTICSKVEKTT
ncbi:MAG: bifunctional glycosyltransferase/class I SAM-dependent methyltransferase [Elusimicrobia bacterium]|nr:bifunctional glycosyltransferase/class I SAM-dependent methyltransferase [Candidatus Obscuribacterium magneticum]